MISQYEYFLFSNIDVFNELYTFRLFPQKNIKKREKQMIMWIMKYYMRICRFDIIHNLSRLFIYHSCYRKCFRKISFLLSIHIFRYDIHREHINRFASYFK